MKQLDYLKTLLEKCLKQVEELQKSSEKEIEEELSDTELAKAILKKLKYESPAKYVWVQKKYLDFRGNPDKKTGEPIKNYYITKDKIIVNACDENQKIIETFETKIWKLNKFKKELTKRGLNKKDDEWYPFIVILKID